MLKILNDQTTQRLVAGAMEGVGALDEHQLAERLADAFMTQLQRELRSRQHLIVFAGPSMAGAVSLLSAVTLNMLGHTTEVILLNDSGSGVLPEVVSWAKTRVLESGLELREVSQDFAPPKMDSRSIVIDGICGTEQRGRFTGSLANVCRFINKKRPFIISLDMPSGLCAEDNRDNDTEAVIHADVTYAFHSPKLAFFLRENTALVGDWKVLSIGLDDNSLASDVRYYLLEDGDMEGAFGSRKRFTNKYDYGRTLLIAGSKGMMGASILAARAAMRAGTGHLTVHLPVGADTMMHLAVPEVLVTEDQSAEGFTGTSEDLSLYDAIAVGPGLGRSDATGRALMELIESSNRPMILDADALYHLSKCPEKLSALTAGSILTPHTGEFDRLFGPSESDYERLMKAIEMASRYACYIVLKGPFTATCTPRGRVIINSSGNPGLATAGTGDVLTGIILALLGKGIKPLHACVESVFIHGYAADLYRNEASEETLTASDVIDRIPMVYKGFQDYSSPWDKTI